MAGIVRARVDLGWNGTLAQIKKLVLAKPHVDSRPALEGSPAWSRAADMPAINPMPLVTAFAS
jgi:hypothetical protein